MGNNNQLKNEDDTAALDLLEQAMGFTFQASLRAATILGVADYLTEEAKTAEELGQTVGADSRHLNRVLRILASRNIFAESADGRFSLTPAAQYLSSDHRDSLRAAVLMLTDKTFWLPLGNLVENLRGESAFKKAFGMSFYEYWSRDNIPESEGDFHTGMSSMPSVENNFLVRSYDFPKHAPVIDIAGGFGGLLLKVLQNNPTL